MTTLYLIRHAEAEGNLYRIAQGQCDSIITDRGYQQIAALAERFRDEKIDAVYSSDLTRTCITAGAIANTKHLPIQKRKDLREICVGEWEEKTWGEIGIEETEQLGLFTSRPDLWHVEGGETMAAVRDRMLAALRDIGEKNEGKTVAVFSHGCALRLALGALEGYDLSEMGKTPHGDNTAVSKVLYENGKLHLLYRDDNSHVQSLSTFATQSWWKRPNGVEPGLYFRTVELPAQAEVLTACVRDGWIAAGETRDFNADVLLRDAAERLTLSAYIEGELAGVLQLNPEKEAAEKAGWISLYCMEKPCRSRGLGVQLLGQAVLRYRALGREKLRLALLRGNDPALRFFSQYGFSPVDAGAAERLVLEKDIRPREWRPEMA